MDPIVNQSDATDDTTTTPLGTLASCGATPSRGVAGRCGYGPRLPLLVISPFAKRNYVDSRATDQSSIIRFIEDNWRSSESVEIPTTRKRAHFPAFLILTTLPTRRR